MDIFTYHAAAETLFGKLQQRKGVKKNKERGGEEKQNRKGTKNKARKQKE
jgi:hypothetical protein